MQTVESHEKGALGRRHRIPYHRVAADDERMAASDKCRPIAADQSSMRRVWSEIRRVARARSPVRCRPLACRKKRGVARTCQRSRMANPINHRRLLGRGRCVQRRQEGSEEEVPGRVW